MKAKRYILALDQGTTSSRAVLFDREGTPVAMAQLIHDNLPGSELVIIPNAAHLSNIEQTVAFDAALLGFIARHA